MKLSKLYTNSPNLFTPIKFNEELNVILGEIRHPDKNEKDTHNLGKTTLAKLLDFMFLAERNPKQFIFKNYNVFQSFTFYLELKISESSYLTIKRDVSNNTRISFKIHEKKYQDYSKLDDTKWNHTDLPIEQAKSFLEGNLNFDVLNHWKYRNIIGYLIRTQNDFNDVFRLSKFQGKDIYWKPYIADLLGFNGQLAIQNYEKKSEISKLEESIKTSPFNSKNLSEDLSNIDGRILLRNNELRHLSNFIDNFNFSEVDQETINELVQHIDEKIAQLNMIEYSIKNNINRVEDALNTDDIKFNIKKVKNLFEEAQILFPDQITRDFEQLIQFNKTLTNERKGYLKEELNELKNELDDIQIKLSELNLERSKQISFLAETELVVKFKQSNNQISKIKGEIEFLNKQKQMIEKIQSLEHEKRNLEDQLKHINDLMETNVKLINEDINSIFSKVRIYFNEIISDVIDKEGSIRVYLNGEDNFEYAASYCNKDGDETSEGDGHSYKKFLCIAFDLAVARAYIDKRYPKFLYIDGVFEGLDIRKKKNMLKVLRKYSQLGIQIILTTINSDISELSSENNPIFTKDEIILTLHDGGQDGLLFKMPNW